MDRQNEDEPRRQSASGMRLRSRPRSPSRPSGVSTPAPSRQAGMPCSPTQSGSGRRKRPGRHGRAAGGRSSHLHGRPGPVAATRSSSGCALARGRVPLCTPLRPEARLGSGWLRAGLRPEEAYARQAKPCGPAPVSGAGSAAQRRSRSILAKPPNCPVKQGQLSGTHLPSRLHSVVSVRM